MIPRVSLVCPICLPPDAVSQALLWKLAVLERWKREGKVEEVRLFTYAASVEHPAIQIIPSMEALLTDPYFCASEVAIYPFAVYNDLLNTVFLRSAPQRTFVGYHNITPEHLVQNDAHKACVRRGLAQRANLGHVDHVFADSPFNKQDLIDFGVRPEKISVLPLPLPEGFPPGPVRIRKDIGTVRILFVGRFVPAKGVADLIDAVRQLHDSRLCEVRARLVGDLTFCDQDYVRSVKELIVEYGLDDVVTFVGSVSPEQLIREYQAADIFLIPSYHEGFCVPVLEALSCGCIVVGYDAGNLPNITAGLGRLVPCGDRGRLAGALRSVVEMLRTAVLQPTRPSMKVDGGLMSGCEFERRAAEHVRSFSDEACTEALRSLLAQHAWPYFEEL
jgi:glycosyltransferase involved in cell wall biosynthesis